MAEKSVKSESGKELPAVGIPFDVDAMFGINQKLYKMMISCNEELMTFGRNRLKEDLDMPQKLAECKTPQDMMNVCLGFYQTAFKQYTEEAGELTRICSEAAAESQEVIRLPGD